MNSFQNFCTWIFLISVCSAQTSIDIIPPIPLFTGVTDDVIDSVETVTDGNAVSVECGGEHSRREGRISSPGYPAQNYSSFGNCTWSIKVDQGKVLVMNFEYMDIEIGPPDCPFDGVIIVDDSDMPPIPFTPGPDPFKNTSWTDPIPLVLGKFCGAQNFKPFFSVTNSVRVGFYSDHSNERGGFVLSWRTIEPKATVHQSCDFEDGLCEGWTNVETKQDVFDWTILKGPTQSSGTGPSFDHTKKNQDGYYAYIEATRPRVAGDNALLASPEMEFQSEDTDYCLEFWYHMYGEKMGTLIVGLAMASQSVIEWQTSGNQGKDWKEASIPIVKRNSRFKIMWSGIVGRDYTGDLAIDDIKVYGKPCVELTWIDRLSADEEIDFDSIHRCRNDTEFQCDNTTTCIPIEKLCDGVVDCPQTDDEDTDICSDATVPPPPIDTTGDKNNAKNIVDTTAVYDDFTFTTIVLDTTESIEDTTTPGVAKLFDERIAPIPRETKSWIATTTANNIVDTTSSDVDDTTEDTRDLREVSTKILPTETTYAKTTAAVNVPVTTEDTEVTTVEEVVTTAAELNITDPDNYIVTTDGDLAEFTDKPTNAIVIGGSFEENVARTTTTSIPTRMIDDTTTSMTTLSTHSTQNTTPSSTVDVGAVTTDKSNDVGKMPPEESTTRSAISAKDEASKDKIASTEMLTTTKRLLSKSVMSTTTPLISSTLKTSKSKSTIDTTISPASSRTTTRNTNPETKKKTDSPTAAVMTKTTETTTQQRVVGNMEAPTMADKQKGGGNGSPTSSFTPSFVILIGIFFSIAYNM